jgi:hypothetical protein
MPAATGSSRPVLDAPGFLIDRPVHTAHRSFACVKTKTCD